MRVLVIVIVLLCIGVGISAVVAGQGRSQEIRIEARKLADGRVEFQLDIDGTKWQPPRRFFPYDTAEVDQWLRSSPYAIESMSTEPTSPAATSPATTNTTAVAWQPIGTGESCLTSARGCYVGHENFRVFSVSYTDSYSTEIFPTDIVLRVGIDIAPGRWRSDYEGLGDRSCSIATLRESVREIDDYVDLSQYNRLNDWTGWELDLLLLRNTDGTFYNHSSVIEERSTSYVYGPREVSIDVPPSAYGVIFSSSCK